jgi:hypothetical protein
MTPPPNAALPLARSEPRTRTALLLEAIALRHQIAVLERSGTGRPCFRLWDRLFWILLARWWPSWRDSLVIVQPATVLRWRRSGWSGLGRYRSRGHGRGGRPRIEHEVRHLITRMARENCSAATRAALDFSPCSGRLTRLPAISASAAFGLPSHGLGFEKGQGARRVGFDPGIRWRPIVSEID